MNKTGEVTAVCTSDVRGIQKEPHKEITVIEDYGIEGDAHAGNWHRQVSLLSQEQVDRFNEMGAGVTAGAFGENVVVRGFDFKTLPVGTHFKCNDVELELTQVGKKCHSHCAIYNKMGQCIMPHEGVFTRVLHGGKIHPGDEFVLTELGDGTTSKPVDPNATGLSD